MFVYSLKLVCFGPNFAQTAKKFTYAEVWGLAISKDGLNALSVRDNDCTISDLSKFHKLTGNIILI